MNNSRESGPKYVALAKSFQIGANRRLSGLIKGGALISYSSILSYVAEERGFFPFLTMPQLSIHWRHLIQGFWM